MSSEHIIINQITGWQDLYELAKVPVGTRLQCQNQSSGLVLTRRTAQKPPASETFGRRTKADSEFIVDEGVPGCFIRCSMGLRLYIQADTPS